MRSPWHKILAGFVGLALAALLSLEAAAYEHPLSRYKARDAYFLGTDSARAARFLSDYVQALRPAHTAGPYVAQIEVRTPYAQIVAASRQSTIDYSAQQAENDYKKAGDTVQVRVQILYPLTGALPLQPPPACAGAQRMNDALACFPDFNFRFIQGKPLRPTKTYGMPIYSVADGSFVGGDVWFIFPAGAVASAPLRVIVTNSRTQRASATFDLATLE